MCCSYHCSVVRSALAKTVWSPLGLPRLLYCYVHFWKKQDQAGRSAVYTLNVENFMVC